MKVWLISDTHFNHDNIATYCMRPPNFTDIIIRNWVQTVRVEDIVLHCGDVAIGDRRKVTDILARLPGRKILIRGNHDRQHSNTWWMRNGFDFSCDGLLFRNVWLTHEPAAFNPTGAELNVFGHLHTIPYYDAGRQLKTRQKLFVLEYLDYMPREFGKFVNDPRPIPYTANGAKHPQFKSEETSC